MISPFWRSCLVAAVICSVTNAVAQPHEKKEEWKPWQIAIDLGYASGASKSMRGTWEDFQFQIEQDYTNRQYPFGDRFVAGGSFGGHAEYHFESSPFGVGVGAHLNVLVNRPIVGTSANMGAFIFSADGLYYFPISSSLDLKMKLGLNTNWIGGEVDNPFIFDATDTVIVPFVARMGFEAGTGLDVKLDWFLLGLNITYVDANVIGKSYTPPAASPPDPLSSRELNDGANPADPKDGDRTIDFLTTSISLGVRF